MKRKQLLALSILILMGAVFAVAERNKIANEQPDERSSEHAVGDSIDSFNGVAVYYNGLISNVSGRNLTEDNYNLGLKYQCVEFVKRYYYEYYRHKMPDSYGHARDFFDDNLKDGEINERRALVQYKNPSQSQPMVGDLVIFDGNAMNSYGHVAIVSDVKKDEIEIIQQNPGASAKSRVKFSLKFKDGLWRIDYGGLLGWLRKERP
jgi:surface antigen